MPLESPNAIDRHVGSRVRAQRLMLEMSETSLGEALGVTPQRVQRYENGTDRIDAIQLVQLAGILKVPVVFFFEPLLDAPAGAGDESHALGSAHGPACVFDAAAISDGLSLVKSFVQVGEPRLRRRIAEMAKEIAADRASPSDKGLVRR
jgi:transcriptional regulator with XRE-family HTH domain